MFGEGVGREVVYQLTLQKPVSLAVLRAIFHLSQEQLAVQAGISRLTYISAEKGETVELATAVGILQAVNWHCARLHMEDFALEDLGLSVKQREHTGLRFVLAVSRITPQSLAKAAGMSTSYIYKSCNGRIVIPRIKAMIILAACNELRRRRNLQKLDLHDLRLRIVSPSLARQDEGMMI